MRESKRDDTGRYPLISLTLVILLAQISAAAGGAPPAAFTEEAVARGIDYDGTYTPLAGGQGLAFADLDNDGDQDLVTVGAAGGLVGLYENDGNGFFTNRAVDTGLRVVEFGSGITAADYDGDGDLDLFFSNWFDPDVLLRNTGNFIFEAATVGDPPGPALTGMSDNSTPGSGSAWGDYNDDGWLDLFVGNRTTSNGSTTENYLFRNLGDGTLVEEASPAGLVGDGATFQGVFFDYDRDGDVDLYVSNDKCGSTGITNQLWRNDGGAFTNVTAASGSGACIDSMGVAVGDLDRNRTLDLYLTNTLDLPGNQLYMNQANGSFANLTTLSGTGSFAQIGWGALFADFDNDGSEELFVANGLDPNRLYDCDGSWPCIDIASVCNVTDGTTLSYGVAAADVDNDGDVDVAVANVLDSVRLFINHEGQTRNWIRFDVVGRRNNHFAVGATVDIRIGNQRQMRQVLAGDSYKSQSELIRHFGLDGATLVDEIEVVWPGGSPTRILHNYPANQTFKLYPPEVLGDANLDGSVDLVDFPDFSSCHAAGLIAPGCEVMDLDGDGDVDTVDFEQFLVVYGGPLDDCNNNGHLDLEEIVLGTSGDLNSNGVPDGCDTPGVAAGRVPASAGGGGPPLELTRTALDIDLSWGDSCLSGDSDFAVYAGVFGDFRSHQPATCSTGGLTNWNLPNTGGSAYYLIVPRSSSREGSYGTDSPGIERRQTSVSCFPQQIGTCP